MNTILAALGIALVITVAALDAAASVVQPKEVTSPQDKIKKARELLERIRALSEALAKGDPPPPMRFGTFAESLKEMKEQLEAIYIPTTDDLGTVTSLPRLFATELDIREVAISSSEAYLTGKLDELKEAKATIEALTETAHMAQKSGEGLRVLSKGIQNLMGLPGVGVSIEQMVYDLEVHLIPGTNGIGAAAKSKAGDLERAIKSAAPKLKNLSGNLTTLRKLTEQEKEKRKAVQTVINARDKLLADVKEHEAAIQAFNAEVEGVKAEHGAVQAYDQFIKGLKYDLCPKGVSFEQCDHFDLRKRWATGYNAHVAACNERARLFGERTKQLKVRKDALDAKEVEFESRRSGIEEQIKKVFEDDRDAQVEELSKLDTLIEMLQPKRVHK